MIDRYGICNSGAEYNDDNGKWVLYEDAAARIDELEADKADLMRVVTDLLGRVDDLMAPPEGQLSMHTYGQSPDWFVEAAVLGAYGTLKAKP
jgi:hypothetical protein